MARWIKIPVPGQFRGEGEWVNVDANKANQRAFEADYEWAKETGFVPTHEGETPPDD